MAASDSGLGFIAHRLVAMLGGNIAVESEPGRGSTFRVWLPAALTGSAVLPDQPAVPVARSRASDPPRGGRRRRLAASPRFSYLDARMRVDRAATPGLSGRDAPVVACAVGAAGLIAALAERPGLRARIDPSAAAGGRPAPAVVPLRRPRAGRARNRAPRPSPPTAATPRPQRRPEPAPTTTAAPAPRAAATTIWSSSSTSGRRRSPTRSSPSIADAEPQPDGRPLGRGAGRRRLRCRVARPREKSVRDFLANLESPAIPGERPAAGRDAQRRGHCVGRFAVNTMIGCAGSSTRRRASASSGTRPTSARRWRAPGVGSGPFLIVPLLARPPSATGSGTIVDIALRRPSTAIGPAPLLVASVQEEHPVGPHAAREARRGSETSRQASLDYYAALRSAYYWDRMAEIAGQGAEGVTTEATSDAPPASEPVAQQ